MGCCVSNYYILQEDNEIISINGIISNLGNRDINTFHCYYYKITVQRYNKRKDNKRKDNKRKDNNTYNIVVQTRSTLVEISNVTYPIYIKAEYNMIYVNDKPIYLIEQFNKDE
ncbi:Hypothetical protein ORPV_234 [Orpheovirus IHUMI-LCC2]|uniref:Uncharacterized protein n=1 Tax=Orpheovirus IHUMI-LCC2 TaxID=2023057 RepID=A0A2I2L3M9_9VIRU|nr:Hypothetical protein ORPV_234 [Orpheovirus IHUMI-LCC2]SNW62138.1 Hypothetical protein ORPV_234 [Orpheovirus IHUMI-LCC2]